VSLPPDLGHVLDFSEFQATRGTGGDAGGFQTLVQPIHAVITFHHFSGARIPLGRAPRAGGDTGFASHTQVLLHKYNAVRGPLLHGPGGAGRHAPGIFTVKAGHEDKRHLWQVIDKLGSHLDNLAGFGTFGKIFIGFALNLTRVTPNTFSTVLEQIILTHSLPP
jgi:hypothetical protein